MSSSESYFNYLGVLFFKLDVNIVAFATNYADYNAELIGCSGFKPVNAEAKVT